MAGPTTRYDAFHQSGGVSKQYYVAEVDDAGNMYGEIKKLGKVGWGEGDAWTHLPLRNTNANAGGGCIAFPFAWAASMPGEVPYGELNGVPSVANWTTTMQVTVLCVFDEPTLYCTPRSLC